MWYSMPAQALFPNTAGKKYFQHCLPTPYKSCSIAISYGTIWKCCNPITMLCQFTAKKGSPSCVSILCSRQLGQGKWRESRLT